MNKYIIKYLTLRSFYGSISYVIASSFLIIWCIGQLFKDINSYKFIEGEIIEAQLYWEDTPFSIKLDVNKENWYSTYISKYFPILKEKARVGKHAKIWYDSRHEFEQLEIEGEVIIPYNKSKIIPVGFIIFGVILFIVNLLYILQNPEHAKGKLEKSKSVMYHK